MSDVRWGVQPDANKAIFDAIQDIGSIITDLTKLEFEWNTDGTLKTLKAYKAADLLYTLSFTWNADATLQSVSRS